MANENTIDSGIDPWLLEQQSLASELAQKKQVVREEGEKKTEESDEKKGSLRERIMAARRAMDVKQRAKEKIDEKMKAPAKTGTSWLLRQAWLSIGTFFGFIFFGLPYINIHVFGRLVMGDKIFCRLGEEWAPKEAKEIAGEFGESGSKIIGIVEAMVLIMLDLAVLLCLTAFLGIFILVVYIYQSPIEAAKTFGLGAVYDIIKALF